MSLDRTFCTRFTNGECLHWRCSWAVVYRPEFEGQRVSWADRKTEDCGYVPRERHDEQVQG